MSGQVPGTQNLNNPAFGQAPSSVPNYPPEATPTPGKAPKKTYYTRLQNIVFHVQRGIGLTSTVQFHGDKYETEDAVEQAQLDGAADVVGSPIYTKKPLVDPGEAAAQKELREKAAKAAAEAGQAPKKE